MVRKAVVLKLRFFGTLAGALLLASTASQAAPVELAFSGTVMDSSIPGATNGDAMTFDVFANNGGANLISQTWTFRDITSATTQAGTYSATAAGPQLAGAFGSFSTNASGQLQTLDFFGLQNGSDTKGSSTFAYTMNGRNNIWFTAVGESFGASSPPSITNTTISLVSTPLTPLPAALPLFATGLGALGLLGWRRKRKDVIPRSTLIPN
jgi:hypothetical protein